jgi:DHA2 family multidrug resistance protein
LLGRRNFLHGLLTLAGVLTLIMAGSALPAAYLMEVQSYRPLEIGPLALTIALPQLVLCPLVATLCNIRRLESRLLMGCGLALLGLSSFAGSFLSSVWIQENFYLLQAMQALGQPLAIVPLLMGATGVVQPMDGPFASAMFNTTRGLSTVIGGALVETLVTEREHLHSNVLLDRAGNTLMQMAPHGLDTAGLAQLAGRVRGQALTMGVADVYLLLSGIAVLLIVLLLLLPQRAYPPQAPPKVAPNLPPNLSPTSPPDSAPHKVRLWQWPRQNRRLREHRAPALYSNNPIH